MTLDKRADVDDIVGELQSGMTIAIGGWASRRKPMALIRAILRSDITDLTVLTWGGPDLGLLCAAGKARRAIYAFCSLDTIAMDPHFRKARQTGAIEDEPYDEGLLHLGLLAASWRVPFLPARAGLGSDLFRDNDRLRTVASPYDDREELVAAPAFEIDAAICHLNRADQRGNAMFLGPDLYWDDVMLAAAPTGKRFVTTERIVPTDELLGEGCVHQLRVPRMSVDAVVETPLGAHFTSCDPDYPRDEEFQREYAQSAGSDETWSEFQASWIDIEEHEYVERVTRRFGR